MKKLDKKHTKFKSIKKEKLRLVALSNLKLTSYLKPQKWFIQSALNKHTKVSRFRARYLKLPNKPYPTYTKSKKDNNSGGKRKFIDLRVYRRLQIDPTKIKSNRILLKCIRKFRLQFGYRLFNYTNPGLNYPRVKPKAKRVLPLTFTKKLRTDKPLVLSNTNSLKKKSNNLKKIRSVAYKKIKFNADLPDVTLLSTMLSKLKPKLRLVGLKTPNRPAKILNNKLYTKILNKKKSKHYLSVLMGLSNDEYIKGKKYNYKENKIILSDNLNRFKANIFIRGTNLSKEEREPEYVRLAELYSRGNLYKRSLNFRT